MADQPAQGDLTVICVSGLGGSAAEWERVRPSLASRGEVVVLAVPAGVQGNPLEAGRRLLVAEMCRAGRQRTILVGHSMGAVVALFAAATEPDRVARLVLTAPFLPLGRNGRSTGATVADYARHRVLFAAGTLHGRPSGAAGKLSARSRAAALRSLAGYGLRPSSFHARVDRVSCPVLVVHGGSDHYVPPAFAQEATRRHRTWQLELIPAAGHFPHRDAPRAWTGAVIPWLAGMC